MKFQRPCLHHSVNNCNARCFVGPVWVLATRVQAITRTSEEHHDYFEKGTPVTEIHNDTKSCLTLTVDTKLLRYYRALPQFKNSSQACFCRKRGKSSSGMKCKTLWRQCSNPSINPTWAARLNVLKEMMSLNSWDGVCKPAHSSQRVFKFSTVCAGFVSETVRAWHYTSSCSKNKSNQKHPHCFVSLLWFLIQFVLCLIMLWII